jgi:RHH-type proline utilization regulon transcriptional repressor/proline dehydrogenase/delta 1-pyrroline-5-carboxylate dehydrogenase
VAGHGKPALQAGTYVPPTLIEIDGIAELQREVFGPVLHFLRFRRDELDTLVGQVNGTGYGLTMGLHTRIDETIARVVGAAHAGNVYVNRNMVGAVVGVQPFGGEGLSGTGPKAGGPLYLYRLLARRPDDVLARVFDTEGERREAAPSFMREAVAPVRPQALRALQDWARDQQPAVAAACSRLAVLARRDASLVLPGPTGERNIYAIAPRASVLCLAASDTDRLVQLAAVLAVGSRAIWPAQAEGLLRRLPPEVRAQVAIASEWFAAQVAFDAVLLHGSEQELADIQRTLARREGPVVSVERMAPGETAMPLERLVTERALSINTAAAGGNASLMTIG